jgi:hypothetical protein
MSPEFTSKSTEDNSRINREARLIKDGVAYRLDIDDVDPSRFSGGTTSCWFQYEVMGIAKAQLHGPLTRPEVLQLVAETLQCKLETLEETLDWLAQYMALHDVCSVQETHLWPREL